MTAKAKSGVVYPLFFLAIGVLFVGLLVYVYLISRRVNPEMLNEKGQRIQAHHP
jgi:hypothetical protein